MATLAVAALVFPLHLLGHAVAVADSGRPPHASKHARRAAAKPPKATQPTATQPASTPPTTSPAPAATTPSQPSSSRAANPNHRQKAAGHHFRLAFGAATRHKPLGAGDPSAEISDFKFTPASLTIHAGDTVTWTNQGPTAHTATANNRSFDSGILQKGASYSHTFAQAGTYAYICTLHPFMHGTVVVLASATPSSGNKNGSTGRSNNSTSNTSNNNTSSNNPSTTSNNSGSNLPLTGLDLAALVLCAAVLIAAGIVMRRAPGSSERR